jgi:large subunit ribosomal protein L17
MRHLCKKHHLSRPSDQKKAMIRALATSLFAHGEIRTTMARAKALRPYAEKIISLGKRADLHARRQAAACIYDQSLEGFVCSECKTFKPSSDDAQKCECGGKAVEKTVLRKLFSEVAPGYAERNGGFTRIFRTPPRRGDNSEMALIQLV